MLLLYCEQAMNRKGFTLIELVMILVLVGILAAVVAPRLGNISSMKAGTFIDKLRTDIRYAQNLAMTRGMRSRVYFNGTGGAPASGYAVVSSTTSTCSALSPATDPATGQPLTIDLTLSTYSGVGITLTLPAMTCLEYDSLGRPYNCTGVSPLLPGSSCFNVISGLTVTINAPAGVVGSIMVSSQTGVVN